MLSQEQLALLKKAQDTYGITNQLSVVMEECCELATVLAKYIRYPDHESFCIDHRDKDLLGEIADVYICLHHLIMMFNVTTVELDGMVDAKLARLKRWLDASPDMLQTVIDRDVKVN